MTSRKNSLELVELSSINKVSLVQIFSCSNTGSIRDNPYWTSRKNSLELIELSSINKVSLVQVSSCSKTGSIRDDPYWTPTKNSLELIELSSINKVSLVQVFSCSNTGSIRDDSYWASSKNFCARTTCFLVQIKLVQFRYLKHTHLSTRKSLFFFQSNSGQGRSQSGGED